MSGSILVIDDDWEIRSTLQELLGDERYKVEVATDDGLPAWKGLDEHPGSYEVILLDRKSPGAEGAQVAQIVERREKASPHLTIVIGANHNIVPQAIGINLRQHGKEPFSSQAPFLLFSFFRACALNIHI